MLWRRIALRTLKLGLVLACVTALAVADEVVNITHANGGFTEYDDYYTGGGDISVTTDAALSQDNAYGLDVLVDDSEAKWVKREFTTITSNAMGIRFYFDPNSVSMNNNTMKRLLGMQSGSGGVLLFELMRANDAYNIWVRIKVDNGDFVGLNLIPLTDEPHYIETLVEYSSSSTAQDGKITVWVDGEQKEHVANLDNYDTGRPNNFKMGIVYSWGGGVSGTYYLDEVVIRNDNLQIGPVGAPPQPPPPGQISYDFGGADLVNVGNIVPVVGREVDIGQGASGSNFRRLYLNESVNAFSADFNGGLCKAGSFQVNNWTIDVPDYVFAKDYKLMRLEEIEQYVREHRHLPGVPSSQAMKENGLDLTQMNLLLLKKVEELTLYTIEQDKKISKLEKEIGVVKGK